MARKQEPYTTEQIQKLLGAPPENMPRHIAVIPDGNGRWATKRTLTRIMGHREGIKAVRNLVRESQKLGIEYVTIYAFSMENWKRPQAEVNALWRLLKSYIKDELPDLKINGVQLRVIGRIERIPKDVVKEIDIALEETKNNDKMVLTIALSYSGRNELVHAVKNYCADVAAGKADPKELDEEIFEQYLETKGIPDPDLMIRTSGENRISNYLLWQLAYSEIYVTPTLWPDFKLDCLYGALKDYMHRERRFGQTSEQLTTNHD